jgi:tRNA G26 N,N-dimethylase Trm1|tara:strand:+ start:5570 stop:5791 length:222 start_codon:yes stop_codon:yes gene_type:complete
MLFKRSDDDDEEEDVMFFNPDMMVNRLDLVLRLIKEADKIQRDDLREILIQSASVTLESIRKGLGSDADNTYH